MRTVASSRPAATSNARNALRAHVLRRMQAPIARLVLALPPSRRAEGEQVARLGVLVALERFDPTGRATFRAVAVREARSELRRYLATARAS